MLDELLPDEVEILPSVEELLSHCTVARDSEKRHARSATRRGGVPKDGMTDRLLDATEIADRLGVPETWVRQSARSGAMAATCASTWLTSRRGSRSANDRGAL